LGGNGDKIRGGHGGMLILLIALRIKPMYALNALGIPLLSDD
jgi:hypothetical protein